jgi:hypothetical protein
MDFVHSRKELYSFEMNSVHFRVEFCLVEGNFLRSRAEVYSLPWNEVCRSFRLNYTYPKWTSFILEWNLFFLRNRPRSSPNGIPLIEMDFVHSRLELYLLEIDFAHSRMELYLFEMDYAHSRKELYSIDMEFVHSRPEIIFVWNTLRSLSNGTIFIWSEL